MSGSNIAFILTGSVSGYKACDAISRLVQLGHRVRTVATESALRFVGPATLEGLPPAWRTTSSARCFLPTTGRSRSSSLRP
jgi:hypothetical protein